MQSRRCTFDPHGRTVRTMYCSVSARKALSYTRVVVSLTLDRPKDPRYGISQKVDSILGFADIPRSFSDSVVERFREDVYDTPFPRSMHSLQGRAIFFGQSQASSTIDGEIIKWRDLLHLVL